MNRMRMGKRHVPPDVFERMVHVFFRYCPFQDLDILSRSLSYTLIKCFIA
jgi:hypothetical protein